MFSSGLRHFGGMLVHFQGRERFRGGHGDVVFELPLLLKAGDIRCNSRLKIGG